MSSGPRVGGQIAVVDVATDQLVTHIKAGTGSKKAIAGIGAATSEGLAVDPFWWFERQGR
jgi:hypothetical protein